MDPYSRSSNGKGSNGSGISNSNNSLNNNNNTGSNGPVPNDSVELLLQNDNDPMDDAFHREESHYRRSSFHHSDNRENNDDGRDRRDSRDRGVEGAKRGTRGRSRSPDRSREHHSGSARNQHDRDDKYDGERRSSHHEHDRSARGGRSRSRSPSRFGSGSSAMRDRRVYVGNLSYDVKWTNLKDFMRQIGPVAHADVLLGPDGRSKGCGVVEYSSADDARESIRKLNDVVLMGRPVFVREDRESEARIGFSGGRNSGVPSRGGEGNTRQIYVANLPYSVNWKDMKDLFRRAGPVDRADVFMTQDMRSKGSGTVMFERASDVSRAVGMFNGFEWHGRRIEVREDKFGPPAGGGGGGGGSRGSSRYEPTRNSHRSDDYSRGNSGYNDSYGGYSGTGHSDYRHDSGSSRHHDAYDGTARSNHHSSNYNDMSMDASIPSGPAAGSGDQIYIRNLPYTTTEQDLRDLFRTCGPIRMAEIMLHNGRPKGSGIVRFEMFESADKAVAKFNGYTYGGRPLEIMYDRA
ncbi:hypothetical protein B0O80DRAFT_449317 [Mortierella sp. GBAus27b]|nr:hypothetical protein B0O80DRAFT_449317 [Mortierella sp. GBAus27b]